MLAAPAWREPGMYASPALHRRGRSQSRNLGTRPVARLAAELLEVAAIRAEIELGRMDPATGIANGEVAG